MPSQHSISSDAVQSMQRQDKLSLPCQNQPKVSRLLCREVCPHTWTKKGSWQRWTKRFHPIHLGVAAIFWPCPVISNKTMPENNIRTDKQMFYSQKEISFTCMSFSVGKNLLAMPLWNAPTASVPLEKVELRVLWAPLPRCNKSMIPVVLPMLMVLPLFALKEGEERISAN